MITCPICRDTDEMCSHTAPAVSADGWRYRIAVTGLPLDTQLANLVEHVRAQEGRIAALEDAMARMQERERVSGEP